MALVLRGQRIEVPGVRVLSWQDDPHVAHSTRGVRRTTPPHGILLHSFGSRSYQGVVPGAGTVTEYDHIAGQVNTNREGTSEDFMVLVDGRVLQYNDPTERTTYHGSSLNPNYLGIEIQQGTGGVIYAASIEAAVKLVDALTKELGIQRQIPWKDGRPQRPTLQRFRGPSRGGGAGVDYNGLLGHRNADDNRGDPGDGIMLALKAAGYEGFDLDAAHGEPEDKRVWKERQRALGVPPSGVADAATVAALKAAGPQHKADGLWVARGTQTAAVVPPGGVGEGTPDARGGEEATGGSGVSWGWWLLVALLGGGAVAAGVAAKKRQGTRGNAGPEPTRLYAPVPGNPGRRRYGSLRAFEATGTVDDHDGRGPHEDLFRHEFTPRAAPSLDFDARKRLHFSGGQYTVTPHGVEDRPRANRGSTTMWRPMRANAGLSVSAGLGAGTVLLAVAGGVVLQYGAQLGLNYALRPAEGADAKTVRMRVILREVLLGVGFAGLTMGAVAMGRPLATIVFGVGTASIAGRNLARTDAGQKLLQKMQEYMTASRLPAIPPPAGTGAVDSYGSPVGLSGGAFSDTVRMLQAVGQ